jgi:solute carrier family 25 phosphate transporter 3
VKVQTSVPGTFPVEFGAALAAIRKDPNSGFPFRSLVPLWSRQVPYTMAKFYFFEMVKEEFYRSVFTAPKESYSKGILLSPLFLY